MTAFRSVSKLAGPAATRAPEPAETADTAEPVAATNLADPDRASDDVALLAAIRSGDPAVADAFCRRVWPQVDRTVRRLLGRDDHDGEDLSQIAVIELVKTIGAYRGECALDTWVSAVTAHVVYKQLRRRPAVRHISLDLLHEDSLPVSGMNGERHLAIREVLARILGHLDEIGEKLAWSFVLHDVLGHGLRDVARILRISEAAAQSRLVRGRGHLHKRIAEDPELAELFADLERRRKP